MFELGGLVPWRTRKFVYNCVCLDYGIRIPFSEVLIFLKPSIFLFKIVCFHAFSRDLLILCHLSSKPSSKALTESWSANQLICSFTFILWTSYIFFCLFLMAIIASPIEEFLGLMNLSIEMICYYLVSLLNFIFIMFLLMIWMRKNAMPCAQESKLYALHRFGVTILVVRELHGIYTVSLIILKIYLHLLKLEKVQK